jgi:hypothetical protein
VPDEQNAAPTQLHGRQAEPEQKQLLNRGRQCVWQSKSDEIETGQHASTRFLSGAQKSKRENKTKYPQDPDVETQKKKEIGPHGKEKPNLGA